MRRGKNPSKNRRYINPTSIAVTVATAVAFLLLAALGLYNAALKPVSRDSTVKLVEIPRVGARQLAVVLKREGLIRNVLGFRLMMKTSMALENCPAPKAGYYDLSQSMSSEEILQRICTGDVAKRKVTFPEGFTIEQMGERMEEKLHVKAADFVEAADGTRIKRALSFRLPRRKLEGYLYPATYNFPVGTPAEPLVSEMVAAFDEQFVKPNAAEIRRNDLSLHDLVTLASLVEREARVGKERPIIAGVLRNRLKQGMRLQCDATVQYALGKHKSRLLYSDLKVDSPYNTYLHKGLPPGAICNPGLECLEAALRPAQVPYLFYVARKDGSHVFTKTYAEHQKAIQQVR